MRAILALLAIVSAVASASDRLFVVNSLDESLGWVDLTEWTSDPHAATLGFLANDIVAMQDALCVVNSGDNNIQVIDPVSLQTIRHIELNGAVNPYAATELDNNRIAVTASVSGTLSIVNWREGTVDTTFYVGVAPQFVDAVLGELYVLCTGVAFPEFGNGVLKRFDRHSLELIDSLVVGVNPQSMIVAWSEIQVLCTGNYDDVHGSVVVIDATGELSVDTVLSVGGSPASVVLGTAPGIGSGWITAGGWGDEGYVYQYNAVTHEILHDAQNPIVVGAGAIDVAAEGYDGGALYVSCFNENYVQVLSCWGVPSSVFEMSAGPSAIDIWHGPIAVGVDTGVLPGRSDIVTAYPNPFNGVLSLQLSTPIKMFGSVEIFDILGRQVADIPVRPGEAVVQWRPGADAGQEVSAGFYFAQLKNGAGNSAIRVIYLK